MVEEFLTRAARRSPACRKLLWIIEQGFGMKQWSALPWHQYSGLSKKQATIRATGSGRESNNWA
jgi:hypothetical protein